MVGCDGYVRYKSLKRRKEGHISKNILRVFTLIYGDNGQQIKSLIGAAILR
jgi:hypothetical protein